MAEINNALVSMLREIVERTVQRAETAARMNVNMTLTVYVVNTRSNVRHLARSGDLPDSAFDSDGWLVPYADELFADWAQGQN